MSAAAGCGPVEKAAPGQIWRGQESKRLIRLVERVDDGWSCNVLCACCADSVQWISDWQLS